MKNPSNIAKVAPITREQVLANMARRQAEQAERTANGGCTLAEIAAYRNAEHIRDEIHSEVFGHLVRRQAARMGR